MVLVVRSVYISARLFSFSPLYEDTNPVLEQVEESISMAEYKVLDGNHDSVIVRDDQYDF